MLSCWGKGRGRGVGLGGLLATEWGGLVGARGVVASFHFQGEGVPGLTDGTEAPFAPTEVWISASD